jgi:hypothetical protein
MDQKPSDFVKDKIGENGLNGENSLTAESEIKTFESAGDEQTKDVQQQTEEHEAKQAAKYSTFLKVRRVIEKRKKSRKNSRQACRACPLAGPDNCPCC